MSDRLATLIDLRGRIIDATGPDMELDTAIMAAFYSREKRYIGAHWEDTGECYEDDVWVDKRTNKWVSTHAFEFTGSIDRASAFVSYCLPGWSILVAFAENRAMANVHSQPLGTDGQWFEPGKSRTAPLAICAALLTVLIAQESSTQEAGNE